MALGATKLEHFAVVSDKRPAMAWVDGRRAEVTLLQPHLRGLHNHALREQVARDHIATDQLPSNWQESPQKSAIPLLCHLVVCIWDCKGVRKSQ